MLKPLACNDCILEKIGNSFSVPDGLGTLGVTIIGEGLGHDEAVDGRPFRPRAQAGSLLERVIKSLGYSRSQFKLWNLIGCQPPGNKLNGAWYEQRAIEHCKVHFDSIVPRNGKNVILALGNLPLKYLTGASGIAKEKQSVSFLRGFVLRSPYGLVIPSFHPSYLRRGAMKYFDVLRMDLQRAVDVAMGVYIHSYREDYVRPSFILNPSLDDARSFAYKVKDSPRLSLGCDIETPNSKDKDAGESLKYDENKTETDETEGTNPNEAIDETEDMEENEPNGKGDLANQSISANGRVARWKRALAEPIISIQFSLDRHSGIYIPWKPEYLGVTKAILALDNDKLWWNGWGFDLPRIRYKGVNVRGRQIDLMWKWHHFQPDLDRNLQFAASYCKWPYAWKHWFGGDKMPWYAVTDTAVLHQIDETITPMMRNRMPKGVLLDEGWTKYTLGINEWLEDATKRGVPINSVTREEVRGTLEERRQKKYKDMQLIAPIEIRNLTPRREIGK